MCDIISKLQELKADGWEWDLRATKDEYHVSLWKPDWVTDDIYQARACVSGRSETSIKEAVDNAIDIAKNYLKTAF